MGKRNQWISDNMGETRFSIDTSFGLYLHKQTGGTISGNLTVDGSLIIKGFNDSSLYWISVNITGDPSANIVL